MLKVSRDGVYGDFVSFVPEFLDVGVVREFVGHVESCVHVATVGIFPVFVKKPPVQIPVLVVHRIVKGDGHHLRNLEAFKRSANGGKNKNYLNDIQ